MDRAAIPVSIGYINGMFCGSRQIHGKVILYEKSIKAPMIVYAQGCAENRNEDHLMVQKIKLTGRCKSVTILIQHITSMLS